MEGSGGGYGGQWWGIWRAVVGDMEGSGGEYGGQWWGIWRAVVGNMEGSGGGILFKN